MIHDDAQLLLAAGAALDDLEADERRAFDAHRATCAACRGLEDELELVLADLALAVPERVPPPDLLAGIRMAIDAEETIRDRRAAPAPSPVAGPAVTPVVSQAAARAVRRPTLAGLGLAAAFAILAVGLGARSIGLSNDLDRSAAELTALRSEIAGQGAVMAVAVDPRHVTATLHAEPLAPGASAVVVFVPGTRDAYLVAHDLPATPAGHAYQLWYADAAGVHALGTATWSGDGTFVAPFDVDLARSAAVMVTLEPSGGSTGEPGPQVVFGELDPGI
jgi:anti-sigma-K factor RskA